MKNNLPVVPLLYSYLKFGLPVLLGVMVENLGGHAITMTGYTMRPHPPVASGSGSASTGVPLMSLRVDGFFAHDDQIGPFSQLDIKPAVTVGQNTYPLHFESAWTDPATGRKLRLYPHVVIAPVYHKIRLTFLDVQKWLTPLNDILQVVLRKIQPKKEPPEWDVYLAFSNAIKGEVRTPGILSESIRQSILLAPHPRFVWRAILRVDGQELIDILFDATAIARSFPIYTIIWTQESFAVAVKTLLDAPHLKEALVDILGERFLTFLGRSIDLRRTPAAIEVPKDS